MSAKIRVSVLVQTRNEEHGILTCLQALEQFEQVIVVDSNSDDRTVEIARAWGAQVVNFNWNGEYPKKKQWQLDNVHTENDWVLFLDADEIPSKELLRELRALKDDCAAYDITLKYVFEGRALHHGHRVTKRCLLRRSKTRYPIIDDTAAPGMGELEGHYQPKVNGRVGKLRGTLIHEDKDPIRTWFDRHNRYSDWEAFLLTHAATRKKVAAHRSAQGQLFDKVPGKPVAFFIYAYVVRFGFLDGREGLDYALALAFYYWQINLKVRELRSGRCGY